MNVALSHWQGRIAPVFDVAGSVLVVETKNHREVGRHEKVLHASDPILRAREVTALGIDVLLCGAVSRTQQVALGSAGVRVVGFVCGNAREVLDAFLTGRLEKAMSQEQFLMPGCRGGRRRFRHRGR